MAVSGAEGSTAFISESKQMRRLGQHLGLSSSDVELQNRRHCFPYSNATSTLLLKLLEKNELFKESNLLKRALTNADPGGLAKKFLPTESGQKGSESSTGLMKAQMRLPEIEEACSREHVSIEKTTKIVTSEGDTLHLERCHITLTIPPGALPEGQQEIISLEALEEVPDTLVETDVVVALTCRCERGSNLKRFNVPVTLMIPHCAGLIHAENVTAALYVRGEGVWGSRIQLERDGIPGCHVHEKFLELRINHFCDEIVCLDKNDVKSKVMGCAAFLPEEIPETKLPIMRLYVYNKCGNAYEEEIKRIMHGEREVHWRLALPEQEFCFQTDKDGGDLNISCVEMGQDDPIEEEKILKLDVMRQFKNVFDVVLNLKKRSENIILNIILTQEPVLNKRFRVQTDFSFREGRAVSGAEGSTALKQVRRLGQQLGLSSSDVELQIRRHCFPYADATFGLLLKWLEKVIPSKESDLLRQALLNADLGGLASKCLPTESEEKVSESSPVLMTSEMCKIEREETCSKEQVSIEKTSKMVTSGGNTLQLERCNITLTIPPGALPEGQEEMISVEALDEVPDTLADNGVVVALTCRCKRESDVEGFNLPVSLKIPHCAKWNDKEKVKAVLYTKVNEVWTPGIPLPTVGTPRCYVHDDYFELWVDHFCSECDMAVCPESNDVQLKDMGCVAFLPEHLPLTRQAILRAYIYNKCRLAPDETRERINRRQLEDPINQCVALTEQDICFQTDCDGGDLKIKCVENKGNGHFLPIHEKSYPKIVVARRSTTSFHVILDLRERQENMMLTLYLNQAKLMDEDFPLQTNYVLTKDEAPRGAEIMPKTRVPPEQGIMTETSIDISDEEIVTLTGMVGNDIKQLCMKLGFGSTDLQAFNDANAVNLTKHEGTFQMLTKWNKKEGATRDRLAEALRKAGEGKLAGRLQAPGTGGATSGKAEAASLV